MKPPTKLRTAIKYWSLSSIVVGFAAFLLTSYIYLEFRKERRSAELLGDIAPEAVFSDYRFLASGSFTLPEQYSYLEKSLPKQLTGYLYRYERIVIVGDENTKLDSNFLTNFKYLKDLVIEDLNSMPLESLHRDTWAKLRSITILDGRLREDACSVLTNAPSLRWLSISSTNINFSKLHVITNLHLLESVDFSHSSIDDAGLTLLSALTNLTSAQLNNTSIGDKGLMALSNCAQLRQLFLENTMVTDDGLLEFSSKTIATNLHISTRSGHFSNSVISNAASFGITVHGWLL